MSVYFTGLVAHRNPADISFRAEPGAAAAILARTRAERPKLELQDFSGPARSEGSARLLQAAAQGDRLDKRLFTGVARVTGAQGNTTALVGTPAQVADALLDYYDRATLIDRLDYPFATKNHVIWYPRNQVGWPKETL